MLADAMSWQDAASRPRSCWPGRYHRLRTNRCWRGGGCLRASNLFFGVPALDAARSVLAVVRQQVHCPQTLNLVVAMEAVFAFFAGGELAGAIALGTETLGADALSTANGSTANVWAALATSSALALLGPFGRGCRGGAGG